MRKMYLIYRLNSIIWTICCKPTSVCLWNTNESKMDVVFTWPIKMSRILLIFLFFLANIAFSITIVLLNKSIYTYHNYPNLTMTCIHFAFTALGLTASARLGIFRARHCPLKDTLSISVAFCAFVVLNNLSLQHNTVGTCQTIKCLALPCIVFIQSFFYKKTFAWKIKITLIPIILGTVLNSNFDLKFSVIGVTYGLTGVVATSLYQVWIGEKQKKLKMDAMQLLYHQAPVSVVFVAILAIISEAFSSSSVYETWSLEVLGLVLLSGIVAFGLNISIFWIIGTTSPLTYNMVGHSKFIMTLLGGYVLFSEPVQPVQVLGVLFTFCGVFMYTFLTATKTTHKVKKTRRQVTLMAERDKNISHVI